MNLLLFSAIAVALGGLIYRVLPTAIRKYVDLDSSLGELLAFGVGAAILIVIIAAAWAMYS